MFMGWALSSASMVLLLMFSNLERIKVEVNNDNDNDDNNGDDDNNNGDGGDADGNDSASSYYLQAPDDAPSIAFFTFTLLLFGAGFWFR